jgi:glycosyltransferase involved in cell wall biosynthesis
MGKFAPDWYTLEMTRLPAALAELGVPAELHMIGDKIHESPHDDSYPTRMRDALSATPGVVWHGGVAREKAWELAAGCDLGLSWRDRRLDESLELSTKLLEYGRLGLPALLNRTPMHEALLGVDYPLLVDDGDVADIAKIIAATVTDEPSRRLAVQRCTSAAEGHSVERAADRVRGYLASAFPVVPALAARHKPLRVLVASHDLKFFERIKNYLSALPGVEVRLDLWTTLHTHSERRSRALSEWADVVICEWCGPNAAWYSRHKRAGQRLIVRLHRYELDAGHTRSVVIDSVDRVVCVSSHYASLTVELTGWPQEKVIVVPNSVDVGQLDRPKLANAQWSVGFIGLAPIERKRFDRALDILSMLRQRDPRFRLAVKTKMPWEYPWIWLEAVGRELTNRALYRVRHDTTIQNAVTFEAFGADVGSWLRGVGFLVSSSEDESFHLAPAEGMASGAVPVIINWPGADAIYNPRWVHSSTEEMAEFIYSTVESGQWSEFGRQARAEVDSAFRVEKVCEEWARLLID